MVELTGEFAEEAGMVLEQIHEDIDFNKKIIKNTHDFESKIQALDMIFWHLDTKYYETTYHGFFYKMSDLITEISKFIDKIRVKDMHFLLEEEAIEKKGKVWITLRHRKVSKTLKKEKLFRKKTLKRIHSYLVKIRRLFLDSKRLFSTDLEKGTVQPHQDNEEIKHILEKLLQFFLTYEKLFKEAVEELK